MKAYVYKSIITFNEEKLDDYIFIELSKYSAGYPSDEEIANVIENDVEQKEMDIPELLQYLDNGYKLLEQGGTDV